MIFKDQIKFINLVIFYSILNNNKYNYYNRKLINLIIIINLINYNNYKLIIIQNYHKLLPKLIQRYMKNKYILNKLYQIINLYLIIQIKKLINFLLNFLIIFLIKIFKILLNLLKLLFINILIKINYYLKNQIWLIKEFNIINYKYKNCISYC